MFQNAISQFFTKVHFTCLFEQSNDSETLTLTVNFPSAVKLKSFLSLAAGCRSLEEAGVSHIQVDPCGDAESAAEGAHLSSFKYQELKAKKKPVPTLECLAKDDERSVTEDSLSIFVSKGKDQAYFFLVLCQMVGSENKTKIGNRCMKRKNKHIGKILLKSCLLHRKLASSALLFHISRRAAI